MKKLIWALVLLPVLAAAQPTNSELRRMAEAEAKRQGVDPTEVEQRLEERGIDVNTLDLSDAPRVQPIVEEIIAEIKAEEKAAAALAPVEVNAFQVSAEDQAAQEVVVTTTKVGDSPVSAKVEIDSNAVFGHHIFANGSLSLYEVSKDYIPADSYILGPGDVITVSIFGRSQADLQFTIKPDGFIEPANLPKVYLKGISLGQARTLVERRFKQFYQFEKGQFALTLTTARTLTVQITGAVGQPGTYTLSAYNTAFNALIAAGGPSKLGSIREIQVISGRKTRTIDVYEYLYNPKNQKDQYLQNNDIIYVPFIKNVVEVEGAVKQVGVFELTDKDNFGDLLDYTGGYLGNAVRGEVQLVRKDANGSFVKEYSGEELKGLTFQDGDKVIIAQETSTKKDYVTIKGEVDYPGVYGIRDYKMLSDVVAKAGVREETKTDVAYIIRVDADNTSHIQEFVLNEVLEGSYNLELQAEDEIRILSLRDFVDQTTVTISGEVRSPGTFTFDNNVTIGALVNLSNGLKPEAKKDHAYVFRKYPNGETEVIPVDLTDRTFVFQDKDELKILTDKDYFSGATISVSGEVQIPMEMPYDGNITLGEVVELCGGLTFAGDSAQLMVYRMPFEGMDVGKLQEMRLNLHTDADFAFQPYDALVVRRKYGFEFQEYVTITGEVTFPGRYAIREGETVKDLLRKAGGVTSEAFLEAATFIRGEKGQIFISIDKLVKTGSAHDDIELLAGDNIHIPSKDYTVEIRLANTIADEYGKFSETFDGESVYVAYVAGRSARWYINNMAGGYSADAKKWSTTVIYANGTAKEFNAWRFGRRYPKVKPGCTIVVGKKEEKPEKEKPEEKFDWQGFTSDLMSQLTAVMTLYTLATKL